MTALRILVCLHDFSRGGTERIAIGLAGSWAAMGRDVTILCGTTEGGLRDRVGPGVKVIALEPPIRRSALSRFRLGPAMGGHLAGLRPDVIFLPGNFHLFLAGGLRRADPRPVIVLKISNPPWPCGFAALPGRAVFGHFTRAVDGFAALTSDFARALTNLAANRPVPVLHDPIYLHEATDSSRMPRDGVCNILWAGRLEPQKDIGLALRTITALNKMCPARLTILGDGALRRQAERMIARLGLGDHVAWLGHVASIDPHLARADALLITSHYEGQPAVAGEALAHGVPLVSTDCSDMLHDVMTIAAAGRIVASRAPGDLAAALFQVCRAPRPPREELAALVARFEPERCARAYLEWFDALVCSAAMRP